MYRNSTQLTDNPCRAIQQSAFLRESIEQYVLHSLQNAEAKIHKFVIQHKLSREFCSALR